MQKKLLLFLPLPSTSSLDTNVDKEYLLRHKPNCKYMAKGHQLNTERI